MHRSGFIALIGEANAGKSTLLNAILGRKISIVTSKPHTTRNRILGVKRMDDAELVFVDTPGFPRAGSKSRALRSELSRHLSRTLQDAASEVDLVVLVLDVARIVKDAPDEARMQKMAKSLLASLEARSVRRPDVIVINKIDLVRKDYLLPLIVILNEVFAKKEGDTPLDVVPISAALNDGVHVFLRVMRERLPESEPLFPPDMDTDQSEQFFAAEVVREKLFVNLREELPHSIAVQVEEWKDEEDRMYIGCLVIIERESHKPIVLGKGGQMLKKVGETARLDLEARFGVPVVLKLFVRVEENWSRSASGLQKVGYSS